MIDLTARDVALIEALARYRLLTIPQAMRIGLGDRSHLGGRLAALERAGLVKCKEQGRAFGGAKVHWLTRRGADKANDLAADKGEAGGTIAAARGYEVGPHLRQRVALVEFHMALRSWAAATGAAVELFRVEFEPNPQGRLEKALKYPWELEGRALTYDPDAVGVVRTADGMRWLFAVEVETGGEVEGIGNFKKRFEERLGAFKARALEHGVEWNEERAARLLFVFATADMQRKAQRWAMEKWPRDLHLVFFGNLEGPLAGLPLSWQKADAKEALPFAINRKA